MTQIKNVTVSQLIKRLQSIKNKQVKVELRGYDDGSLIELNIMFESRAYTEVMNNNEINVETGHN